MLLQPTHELVVFPNGSVSLKPCLGEEAMHSSIGPWEEATRLYVAQSRLAQRLAQRPEGPANSPVVLYDVGMGIAANALAAAECFLNAEVHRGLRIISFEKHLDALELSLSHSERFPFIAPHQGILAQLLQHRRWNTSKNGYELIWELHEGDFLSQDLTGLPPAELIYFDFYSPKATPKLWETSCFEKLHQACQARAELFTYSAATSARSAMMLAGFHVGIGAPTGAKLQTTIATTRLEDLESPLGKKWLDKLRRSDKPLPTDWPLERLQEAIERIARSPQFL